MKKIFSLVLVCLFSLNLYGCSSSYEGMDSFPSSDGGYSSKDDVSSPVDAGDSGLKEDYGDIDDSVQQPVISSGSITAASINDFKDFDYFMNLTKENKSTDENQEEIIKYGVFQSIHNKGYFTFDSTILVKTLDSNNSELRNVKVDLILGDTEVYTNYTNVYGEVNLLLSNKYLGSYVIKATYLEEVKEYNVENLDDVVFEFNAVNVVSNKIDIAFLIDTTGSMGDELEYIKVELMDVLNTIKGKFTNCDIRLAFVFYRDVKDSYIVKSVDFDSNIDTIINKLKLETAGGGGDFPEAVHSGMAKVNELGWRMSDTVTKIMFHVLDAPPHLDKMQEYTNEVNLLAQNGVISSPIASSGINKDTEYLLRCQAMITNGDYIFITDDSGIGGSHLVPSIKEFDVEYLNNLLVRLIIQYHSGEKIDKIVVKK